MTHPAVAQLDTLGVKRTRLVVDSRDVRPGDVFAAFPGAKSDGRDFIEAAVSAGASAVIAQAGGRLPTGLRVPVLTVERLAAVIGTVADDFFDRPSASLPVHAVTGTNGKTTISVWLAQADNALGGRCGLIGTLGRGFIDSLRAGNNTTPDAATVHREIAEFKRLGATSVAMEVSSHALDQARVAGVRFDTGIFTNLTQDHLDYHRTMIAYGEAKAKLFTDYPLRHRVINADDDFGANLISRRAANVVSYGLNRGLVRGKILFADAAQMRLAISSPWGETQSVLAAAGTFNAYNATAVAAALFCRGATPDEVAHCLAALRAAPGRMQRVQLPNGAHADAPCVYVDYAHTPDALEKALAAARETCRGRLWVVYGCGGDRDPAKRPIMGAIAARSADRVIVTNDNPRNESPELIAGEIARGIPDALRARAAILLDRREAIAQAIADAESDDVVLIAGKGHESYQEVAGIRNPFSDLEAAQQALRIRIARKESEHAAQH